MEEATESSNQLLRLLLRALATPSFGFLEWELRASSLALPSQETLRTTLPSTPESSAQPPLDASSLPKAAKTRTPGSTYAPSTELGMRLPLNSEKVLANLRSKKPSTTSTTLSILLLTPIITMITPKSGSEVSPKELQPLFQLFSPGRENLSAVEFLSRALSL